MTKKILDVFCGAGGASSGYVDAGFEVVGVDISPQSNYPFHFMQDDALKALTDPGFLSIFDMTVQELAEAIPPAYTRHVGSELLAVLK